MEVILEACNTGAEWCFCSVEGFGRWGEAEIVGSLGMRLTIGRVLGT